MPRFVILEHTGSADYKPGVHWDLMLEVGDGLRTWELEGPPSEGATVRARELGMHRLDYLDYEGPVSGGRGSVRRWDGGKCKVMSETPAVIEISIHGKELAGRMMLRRDREDEPKWIVNFFAE